jgi:hypothetical protein
VIPLAEEWLFGIPPPVLIIGGFLGLIFLRWLLSEGLGKFVELVGHALFTVFGGKPKKAPERMDS